MLNLDSVVDVALVTGGRGYRDRDKVFEVLDEINPHAIMHGGASGVDGLAGDWARERGRPCTVYPADWQRYGGAAGPIRNREMAEAVLVDEDREYLVVVFPGGKGTANMKEEAEKRGIPTYEVFGDG